MPVRRAFLPLLALLLCAPAARLHAQAADPLAQGTRVRVTLPTGEGRRLTGRVFSATPDTLRLVRGGDVVSIPVATVERLEVSRGRDRLLGAALGAGIGAAAGAAVLALPCVAFADDCAYPGLLASLGVLGGAPVGAVAGAVVGRERWRALPLPTSTSLRVAPHPGGAAVSISLAL